MDRIGKQETRWAWAILILGLVVLLFMTLPPLTVDFSVVDWVGRIDLRIIKTDNLTDWVRNIILFVPFGFGFSALLGRKKSAVPTLLFTALVGFSLSLFLETYQVFNPYRAPAVADVAANTVGTIAGAVLFLLAGRFILNNLVRLTIGIRRLMQQHKLAAGVVLLLLFIGYAVLIWQSIGSLQKQVSLANWDIRVPLSLGNVKTGELPWTGTVSELFLVDQALDATAVAALLTETATSTGSVQPLEALVKENTNTTLATFPDNPVLIDHADKNITFDWIEESNARWLLTDDIIGWWAEDMRVAEQFTIGLQLATAVVDQPTPGRILAMTHHRFVSNLSLEQQGTDLIILLRTVLAGESDKRPEWVLPGFFEDTDPHYLVLTFDGQNLNLYRDSNAEQWQMPYSPDIIYYRYLHPIPRWRVQVGPSLWAYRLLFYLLTAVPLGLFLGAFAALWSRRWLQILILVIGLIFVGFVLEMALIFPGADLRWGRVLLGMGVTAVSAIWTIR